MEREIKNTFPIYLPSFHVVTQNTFTYLKAYAQIIS